MKKIHIILLTLLVYNFSFSQPTQVLDINSGSIGSFPSNLFVYNGLIYFGANDSSGSNTPGGMDLGFELWVSDGTTNGTIFFKDLNSGSAHSGPHDFFELNSNLYFSAILGSGNVLFTSDGTIMGTQPTAVTRQLTNPVELGGIIYFLNTSDRRLYEFNGTTSNPVTGSGSEYIINEEIKAFDGKIFCYMNTSTQIGTFGTELYAYNPATNTFQLVKDIGGGPLDSDLGNLTILGTDLYFSAFSELELWKTDGTDVGTIMISTPTEVSSFDDFYAWNGKLFFKGYDDNSSTQLWVYNPIDGSVTNISNLTGAFPNHDPSDYAGLNEWLYYSGEDSNDNNGHLWRTNGTETFQLDDTIIINAGNKVSLNNKLYFRGTNGTDGYELFEFDPSSLSIQEVNYRSDIVVYPNPSQGNITISRTFQDALNYELLDINGRIIQIGILHNNTIQYQLKSGMYLLNLNNSKLNITKKLLVN